MKALLAAAAFAVLLPVVATAASPSLVEVDISRMPGAQAEVAVAVDPSRPDALFAASNSIDFSSVKALQNLMRTYSSSDGGATWTNDSGPSASPFGGRKRCNAGDPAPTIDAAGHQYLAFLASACLTLKSLFEETDEFDVARLEVASRPSAADPWRVSQVFPVRSARFDDKPAIAVDNGAASPHAGRVYVAWTRITPGGKRGPAKFLIVVSHSDDGGVTWSRPVVVSDSQKDADTFASVAVDSAGTVFVSWTTIPRRIFVDRSTDGGDHFGTDVAVGQAAGIPGDFDADCQQPGSFGIPAASQRCITPDPSLQVDSRPDAPERVYLTFSTPDAAGRAQDVVVRPFDGELVPLGPVRRVHTADLRRDEFLPASAVDEVGRLWVCFYDTGEDHTRRTARYTCTASVDAGTTWALPRPVATVASDENADRAQAFQYGDYEGLGVRGGIAHPIWTDGRDVRARGEEIYTTTLTPADLQLP